MNVSGKNMRSRDQEAPKAEGHKRGGGEGELQRSRFSVSKIKASLFPFRLLLIVFKDPS